MSCRLLADALQRGKRFHATPVITPKAVIEALNSALFQVVLIGMSLPDDPLGGLQLMRDIQDLHPSVNMIVMLDALERDAVVAAFRAGARGIFSRADSFETLCKCVQCVHAGQVWASSAELQFLVDALVEPTAIQHPPLGGTRPLSKREEEIARLVAEGLSNRQISQHLALSEHTIKNYLFRVFEKLGVATRVELALYALKRAHTRRPAPQPIRPSAGDLRRRS